MSSAGQAAALVVAETVAQAGDAVGIAVTGMPLTRERLWRRLRRANVVA